MRELRILGTGCGRCHKLTEQTEAAAKSLGLEYHIEKITELDQIMKYGVMVLPALVVDGQVKVAGKIPALANLMEMLK